MRYTARRTGPFQAQLYFPPSQIDDACLEALRKGNGLPASPGPVKIERFVETYFQCIVGYEDLADQVMGYTAFSKNGSIRCVMISSKLDDGRQSSDRRVRSTWAHEGGHCLLHPSLFIDQGQSNFQSGSSNDDRPVLNAGRLLCRGSDIKPVGARYDGRWWEWQANRAIGGFLLPRSLVQQALEPYMLETTVTRSKSIDPARRQVAESALADIFDVNPVVVRIRLNEMFPDNTGGQIEF